MRKGPLRWAFFILATPNGHRGPCSPCSNNCEPHRPSNQKPKCFRPKHFDLQGWTNATPGTSLVASSWPDVGCQFPRRWARRHNGFGLIRLDNMVLSLGLDQLTHHSLARLPLNGHPMLDCTSRSFHQEGCECLPARGCDRPTASAATCPARQGGIVVATRNVVFSAIPPPPPQRPAILQSSVDAQSQPIRHEATIPHRCLDLSSVRLHAQCADWHVHAAEHIQLPRQPRLPWPCAVVDVNHPIKASPSTAAVNTSKPHLQPL